VSTLAFAVTSSTFFLDHRYVPWFVPDLVPRPALWNRVTFDSDLAMYYVALFGLVLAMAVARSLRKSRTGRALVATRDNASAAKSVSIDTTRVKLTAFAVSGGIAGFAGALYVLHQTAFKTDAFGPEVSLRLFSMVVIGGLGSLPGAIIGAAYIRGAEFFLRGGWALVASGAGIVLLLLFQPGVSAPSSTGRETATCGGWPGATVWSCPAWWPTSGWSTTARRPPCCPAPSRVWARPSPRTRARSSSSPRRPASEMPARRTLNPLTAAAQLSRDVGPVGIFPLGVLLGLSLVERFDFAAFGVLSPEIRHAFHLSDAAFAGIVGLTAALPILLSVWIGYLADRSNRVRITMVAGLLWA